MDRARLVSLCREHEEDGLSLYRTTAKCSLLNKLSKMFYMKTRSSVTRKSEKKKNCREKVRGNMGNEKD